MLVIGHVVPIQRIVLNFWTCSVEYPIPLQLDILDQMTSNLNVTDICGMIERADVVVLHNASGVEIGHERGGRFMGGVRRVVYRIVQNGVSQVLWGVEVLIHVVYLSVEPAGLLVGITDSPKSLPK